MQTAVIFLLACLPFFVLGQQPPCGNRDCPSYTRTQLNVTGGYEVRRYDPSQWVVTSAPGRSFRRLFRYIGGFNDQGAKISMTVPVLRAQRASGSTMMFYLPNTIVPPTPTNPDVQLLDIPVKEFYVRVFNTNSKPQPTKYQQELQALKTAVDGQYNDTVSYTAGYHSPWHTGVRQNEVWLEKL
ncbi:heme-binding protein 2-like [Littorina saxatilis]|uniref:SOUL heme-binding protein n=1 Tax=Littorina saxatilis TaxID=31220 RepID=A0AAN9GQU4_9CAEN